ncbi:uncharacterized protein LOC122242657 [Penaeus japonicus]|uniref:uncharacterized protein LOC122242657 n=1 Tax=Penaeus japonicus TaxID=27405 RepID=UPI001C715144|nr:uncharacterized protein LOC122242657 [Penaeus japonicus]
MGKYKKLLPSYFKFVNPLIMAMVGAGMYLMVMAWLDPKGVSPMFFGRLAEFITWLGTEYNNLMKQLILSTVAIHAFESILALYYCQKLRLDPGVTCCWMVQTLFMGIFSLRYLIWPQREERSAGNSKKSK